MIAATTATIAAIINAHNTILPAHRYPRKILKVIYKHCQYNIYRDIYC